MRCSRVPDFGGRFGFTVLACLWLAGCASTSLQPQERALLVTAADLTPFGAVLPDDVAAFERSSKTKAMGSTDLEYEFDASSAFLLPLAVANIATQPATLACATSHPRSACSLIWS
jgi:hypothetical protein